MFLDPKSGAKPLSWAGGGGATKYTGWKGKLLAHYRMKGDPRVDAWVKWAQVQKEPITSEPIEHELVKSADFE